MRSIRRCVVALAAVALVAACQDADGGGTRPIEAPDTPDAPAEEPAPQPDEEPDGTPEDEVAAVWIDYFTAWHEQGSGDEPDAAAFEGLANDPDAIAAQLAAVDERDRVVVLDAEYWPQVTIDGDSATVIECALTFDHLAVVDEDEAEHRSTGYQGTAVRTDDGWRIESHSQVGAGDCVPQQLNDQLLQAYRDYRDALNDAWDPPDPDHPDLDATMTGSRLDFIRDLLTEHQRDGIVVRDPAPTDDAVVAQLEIGRAVVWDCTEQVPERGAFDLETGERLDDLLPPIEDGQVDFQEVSFVRADGAWKVEEQAASRNSTCTPGETTYVVR